MNIGNLKSGGRKIGIAFGPIRFALIHAARWRLNEWDFWQGADERHVLAYRVRLICHAANRGGLRVFGAPTSVILLGSPIRQ